MKTRTMYVDESQYMPYEQGEQQYKKSKRLVRYFMCPYGCKSQWYTKAAAKKYTCQASRSEKQPKQKRVDPIRTLAKKHRAAKEAF